MKAVVKFDVPFNPWMNCKALLGGIVPALGEICRWGCPAMSELWMPEPCQACVCAKVPLYSLGQNQAGPLLHPALALHWGKSRNTNKTREVVHSTGSSVWIVEGAGNVQNVPAVLLAPGGDVWGWFSGGCGMAGKGWHVAVLLPALLGISSHPAASLSPCVCMQWDSVLPALSCSAVIQHKQGMFSAEATVSTKRPERPPAKATQNNKREFRVHKTSLHF